MRSRARYNAVEDIRYALGLEGLVYEYRHEMCEYAGKSFWLKIRAEYVGRGGQEWDIREYEECGS